jgi:hypothetical protein
MAEAPILVEAVDADVIPRVDNGHANEVEPQPEDASGGAAPILGSLRGPNFWLPRGPTSNDMMHVLGSFDTVDLGAGKLGLLGYPRAPPLLASWGQVVGGAKFTCSQGATMDPLRKNVLATVGWDVLQPARVSPEMKRRGF